MCDTETLQYWSQKVRKYSNSKVRRSLLRHLADTGSREMKKPTMNRWNPAGNERRVWGTTTKRTWQQPTTAAASGCEASASASVMLSLRHSSAVSASNNWRYTNCCYTCTSLICRLQGSDLQSCTMCPDALQPVELQLKSQCQTSVYKRPDNKDANILRYNFQSRSP